MSADHELLARLARLHADGQPLPPNVRRNGSEVPLSAWLQGLWYDRSEVPTHVAALIGHPAEQPTVGEIAMTLSARLSERQA